MTDLVRGIRSVVSQKKRRFRQGEYDLDLTYITPRIIAMGLRASLLPLVDSNNRHVLLPRLPL